MLNKPIGVVSATNDKEHKTVIDVLDNAYQLPLHIVGRLDLNTSGLLLLTNDSRWSESITQPEHHVTKEYLVTLANPINETYEAAFAQGMYFSYEDITTQPAKLSILSSHQAQVSLIEGRYHQIKRMFGRFRNPVIGLKRLSVGGLHLDESLKEGESRMLSPDEVKLALI